MLRSTEELVQRTPALDELPVTSVDGTVPTDHRIAWETPTTERIDTPLEVTMYVARPS
jgi:coenzyme PQQ precursor peptide PqqA